MEQTQVSGYSFSTECSWNGRVRHFRHKSVTQKSQPQPHSQPRRTTESVVSSSLPGPSTDDPDLPFRISLWLQLCLSYRTVTLLRDRDSDTSKDGNLYRGLSTLPAPLPPPGRTQHGPKTKLPRPSLNGLIPQWDCKTMNASPARRPAVEQRVMDADRKESGGSSGHRTHRTGWWSGFP